MLSTLISLGLVPLAHASGNVTNAFHAFCGITHSGCGVSSSFLAAFALRVGNFFAILVGGAAVLAILYAGILLTLVSVDDGGKEKAKNIMVAAIIGLVLAIAAEGVIIFVANFVNSVPGT